MSNREMRLKAASTAHPEPVSWLWPNYLLAGELVVIDGDAEQGKSLLTLDLAARISAGRALPDGHRPSAPHDVILLTGEDHFEDTVLPRLIAAEADLNRVHQLAAGDPDQPDQPLCLPGDLHLLDKAVRQLDARLVVIDPLTMFLDPRLPTGIDSYIRAKILTPLARIGHDTRACMTLVRHLTKLLARAALCKGAGSMAIINAARIAYLIGRDPNDEERRLFACNKNNVCLRGATLAYRIVQAFNHAPRVEWLGTSAMHADDIDAPRHARQSVVDHAVDFLEAALADGPVRHDDLVRQAADQGISRRALKRAKKALEVKSVQYMEDGKNFWTWSLSETTYDWAKDERSRRIMEALCRPPDPRTPDAPSPTADHPPPALPAELIAATDADPPDDQAPPANPGSADTDTPSRPPQPPSCPSREPAAPALPPARLLRLSFTQRGSRANGVIWGYFQNVGAEPALDLVHGFRKGRRFIPQFRTASLAPGAILAPDASGLPYNTDHGKDRDPTFLYCTYQNAHGDLFRVETPIVWTQGPPPLPTSPGPERLFIGTPTTPEHQWPEVP
jgi:hypothetical protein